MVIGTQIVAKGYHFPLLTTVGVIDADLGLTGGDLRAGERTWQLLTQVAGRAGRADRQGQVLVQTTLPSHPVMAALASGDRDRFLSAEEEARRAAGMPPFGRLAALILSDRSEERVDQAARSLASTAPSLVGGSVLGPAPAPLALLRGRYRRRFLVLAPRAAPLGDHSSLDRPGPMAEVSATAGGYRSAELSLTAEDLAVGWSPSPPLSQADHRRRACPSSGVG